MQRYRLLMASFFVTCCFVLTCWQASVHISHNFCIYYTFQLRVLTSSIPLLLLLAAVRSSPLQCHTAPTRL